MVEVIEWKSLRELLVWRHIEVELPIRESDVLLRVVVSE